MELRLTCKFILTNHISSFRLTIDKFDEYITVKYIVNSEGISSIHSWKREDKTRLGVVHEGMRLGNKTTSERLFCVTPIQICDLYVWGSDNERPHTNMYKLELQLMGDIRKT